MQLLRESQITRELFRHFNRRQEVSKCWRREQGLWVLKDDSFVEDWNEQQYEFLVQCLKNTVTTGGLVLGAFVQERLVGFASVESRRFGSKKQYLQLSCIHVSCESRGQGLGKKLFQQVTGQSSWERRNSIFLRTRRRRRRPSITRWAAWTQGNMTVNLPNLTTASWSMHCRACGKEKKEHA